MIPDLRSPGSDPSQEEAEHKSTGLFWIGEALRERQGEILMRWHEAVFDEAGTPQEQIVGALRDRNQFREVLSCLIDGFEHPGGKFTETGSAGAGPLPWIGPWEKSRTGDDAIGRIARLRAVMIDEFLVLRGPDGQRADAEGLKHLASFFDELIRQSGAAAHAELFLRLQAMDEGDRMLREANHRLAQIDRSRVNLTRSVTHELRNMLNAINIATRILWEDASNDSDRETFAMVRRNILRMDELLRELLDYALLLSGRETAKIGPFDPAALFQELVATFSPLAQEKGLSLKSACDPALRALESDEVKVHRIATNLLSNAIKYTSKGEVRIAFQTAGPDEWAIRVEDTGDGIEVEPEQLFEEFYRGKGHAQIRGTGLGLTITRQLVEALSGRIEVSSERGIGSRFEVFLPCRGVDGGED